MAQVDEELRLAGDRAWRSPAAAQGAGGRHAAVAPPDPLDARARRRPRASPASWRRSIGVVPACDAWPREAEAMPLDSDAAVRRRRRAGPRPRAPGPARCGARGRRRAGSRREPASRTRSSSTPFSAQRVAIETPPSASRSSRDLVRVERPRERRAPEEAAAEARALLVGPVDERQRATVAALRSPPMPAPPRAPAITPSAPSSQPPSGTESTCEPTAERRLPRRPRDRPRRFPPRRARARGPARRGARRGAPAPGARSRSSRRAGRPRRFR